MSYSIMAFISVTALSLIHLLANRLSALSVYTRNLLLSVGGGIATAFVFVDILPKLSAKEIVVRGSLIKIVPFFEHHVYLMTLLGFLMFFAVDRSQLWFRTQSSYFWLNISSSALLNFLVGYAVVDKNNPEVQPLVLFTLAIALLYLMDDYFFVEAHSRFFRKYGRWILILNLYLGWIVGLWMELSAIAIALVSAFIAGGVIMNVTRHRLLVDNPQTLLAFLVASMTYACLLLSIGT